MVSSRRSRDLLLLLLAVTAGATDATAFLRLGHVFASVITGNLVVLGLSAARAHGDLALFAGCALGGYALGVILAAPRRSEHAPGQPLWPAGTTVALGAELALLIAFAVAWEIDGRTPARASQILMLVLCASAMGIQSTAVRLVGQVSTTYLTSTLTGLLEAVVARNRGDRQPALRIRPRDERPAPAASTSGYRASMHIKDAFEIRNVEVARAIVRAHPFATLVTDDLRATHMPCLLDDDAHGLAILGHVACADPVAESLGGPLLAIFHGPHGYVSASWYGSETIPTWNHVTLHVRGTPERFDDAMPVLRRTVEHFEAAMEQPWSLERVGERAREMANQVVAFRLDADSWHAEAKLSQDKPAEERTRVLAGLERPGAYANPRLASAMRRYARGQTRETAAKHR